jgi:putative pre-16S rRNA nuclease
VRDGVRLALDLGDARIGVAACDRAGTLAYPVATLPAGEGEVDRIVALVAEYEPIEVVVGLPRSLSGAEGPAAAKVRARATALATALRSVVGEPRVRLVDERLSTVSAARQLRERGMNSRQQRFRIDAAAAVTILEHALDSERNSGFPPGELLSSDVSGA